MSLATVEEDFWINPCGLEKEPLKKDCNISPNLDKRVIKKALKYCRFDVNKSLKDAKNLQLFMKKRHPSLGNIGNPEDIKLFQFLKVPDAHDPCKRNSPLPAEYNLIQKHAVVLQRMMADAENDDEYFELLKENKRSMASLLCSLHELILHLHLRRMADVSKDIMPVELLQNNESVIIMRDNIVTQLYIYRMQHLDKILRQLQMHL